MQYSLRPVDEQGMGEEYSMVAAIFGPSGPVHLACDDVVWDPAREARVGVRMNDEGEAEVMFVIHPDIPVFTTPREAWLKETNAQFAERQFEIQQEQNMITDRARQLFGPPNGPSNNGGYA